MQGVLAGHDVHALSKGEDHQDQSLSHRCLGGDVSNPAGTTERAYASQEDSPVSVLLTRLNPVAGAMQTP